MHAEMFDHISDRRHAFIVGVDRIAIVDASAALHFEHVKPFPESRQSIGVVVADKFNEGIVEEKAYDGLSFHGCFAFGSWPKGPSCVCIG